MKRLPGNPHVPSVVCVICRKPTHPPHLWYCSDECTAVYRARQDLERMVRRNG